MKLSDIRKLCHISPDSLQQDHSFRFQEEMARLGIDISNFYQELEMDSPYVDTHQDISMSNTSVQFHSHAFYELICCRNTCGAEYLIGTERYKLQKGDIIFVPPNISHCPLLPQSMIEPYIRDVLWISETFFVNAEPSFQDWNPESLQKPFLYRTAGTKWEFICDLFRFGVTESENQHQEWQALVLANTLSILVFLRRAESDIQANTMVAEKPELLDQVLAYVEQHLSQKLTLSDIAHQFYISESTITQSFRKKMGVSFYRYVTQRRLIAAKVLIETDLPLEAVSENVGFSDYSSFFRAFKHEYGISPRQFRKMQSRQ